MTRAASLAAARARGSSAAGTLHVTPPVTDQAGSLSFSSFLILHSFGKADLSATLAIVHKTEQILLLCIKLVDYPNRWSGYSSDNLLQLMQLLSCLADMTIRWRCMTFVVVTNSWCRLPAQLAGQGEWGRRPGVLSPACKHQQQARRAQQQPSQAEVLPELIKGAAGDCAQRHPRLPRGVQKAPVQEP